ncbi:hypothetical protein MLD38_008930 [Melastoma candidum]|uniref:Uncharacterized protein n=1 Tax=Melastoma candidum TaxID=119954 RepID=A0ACB9RW40_9MYRT|nr:hypothetical protein MLD38_008930 [Melastoma candidum]
MANDKQGGLGPESPPGQVVAVAVSGRKESKYMVRWALEKFAPEGDVVIKLLHVRPVITAVPTPMGNLIPISQVREDVAAAYKQEIEWQRKQMLLPYRKLCGRKKIQADILVIESDDVANALAEEVTKSAVNKLVIGAATPGLFTRKPKKNNLSSRISACIPSFCTVYAVSRGNCLPFGHQNWIQTRVSGMTVA